MSFFDLFKKTPREFAPNELLPFISSPSGEKPIALTRLDIQVCVSGLYSETSQTMTFYNPNHRALEGELHFPLPDNAVVCGYALDVNGQMVDGVVVPKEEARQILEAEIRKGIDPGLVEHIQGNMYRTRIYPIPARGSRTVRINYVSDLAVNSDEAAYHLPLTHAASIGDVKIKVEVIKSKITPELSGLGNLTLNQWEDRWVAEANLKSNITDDLLIRLPHLPDLISSVERYEDDYFFNLSAKLSETEVKKWHPKQIGIAWDASGSQQNIETDLDFLKTLFSHWNGTKIELIVFRNVSEPGKSFDSAAALIDYLKEIPSDGGTNLAGLNFGKFADENLEACLLFSDGLNNVKQGLPDRFEKPIISINSQTKNDNSYLEYLAEQTNGMNLNLVRIPVNQAVENLVNFGAKLQIESSAGCESIHFSSSQGRLNILGRLTDERAELKLKGPGAPNQSIVLEKSTAATGKIIARAWAEKESRKIALTDKFSEELVQLGRRFGLVTPGTSLLVLESLEQYLEYKIEPPKSLEKIYRQYHQRVSQIEQDKRQDTQKQISNVLEMWNRRISWWEKDFKSTYTPPEDEVNKKTSAPFLAGHTGELIAPAMPSQSFASSDVMPMTASAPRSRSITSSMMDFMEAGAGSPEMERGDSSPQPAVAKISIQPWSPQTPYLLAMKAVAPESVYGEYLKQRKDYQNSPSFFLDCGDYFFSLNQRDLAVRVLSNLLELQLDDIPLLRIYGWRLQQAGELDLAIEIFERVRKIRNDEPQSHRDLALALGERWFVTNDSADALRSIRLLYDVILQTWERFPEIEIIALMELNRLIYFCQPKGIEVPDYIDRRLIKNLDLDVRISLSWDADLTDVDLHVFEPDGGHAYYGHNLSRIGGLVSRDFTRGYGPEEYVLRQAMPGKYLIKTHYYGSHQQTLCGPCTITATVFTNYGRKDEMKQILTLRLEQASNEELVGEISIEGEAWIKTSPQSANLNEFKALKAGMTIDEIKNQLGNSDSIRGDDNIVLVYQRGSFCVELHCSPRLTAVKQIMQGAEVDLLN